MTRHLAPFLLAAAACGNGGSATFNGTVHGQAMTPRDYISSPATVRFASGTAPAAAIVISDAGTACTMLAANQQPKSSRSLAIYLSDVDQNSGVFGVPSGVGAYTVFTVGSGPPPAHFAVASFRVDDAACNPIAAQSATAVAGTVALTAIADGAYAGTYDLSFDSGDRVTGTFNTAVCRALATFLANNTHGCG
jgi:hypothetical protein